MGLAAAQLVEARRCVTGRKFVVSFPHRVIGIFIDLIFSAAL
jgi:hypothetical protein